jgi:hypothetical protein
MHRISDRHQHAAFEIAYTGDETRVFDLRPQSMAHYVVVVGRSVQLLRHVTVHSEAPAQFAPAPIPHVGEPGREHRHVRGDVRKVDVDMLDCAPSAVSPQEDRLGKVEKLPEAGANASGA